MVRAVLLLIAMRTHVHANIIAIATHVCRQSCSNAV